MCRAIGQSVSPIFDRRTVAAPLVAAWDSIRTGLRRDLRRAHLRRLAEARGAWRVRRRIGRRSTSSCRASSWPIGCARISATGLAWRGRRRCRSVREVRIVAAADAPRPAPLLILEEIPAAPAPRSRARSVGAAISIRATGSRRSSSARPMKSPRPPPRRWQRADSVSFNPLVHPWRHRARQDPSAARHRPGVPRTPTRRRESCRCRPKSSWSSSSARCARMTRSASRAGCARPTCC